MPAKVSLKDYSPNLNLKSRCGKLRQQSSAHQAPDFVTSPRVSVFRSCLDSAGSYVAVPRLRFRGPFHRRFFSFCRGRVEDHNSTVIPSVVPPREGGGTFLLVHHAILPEKRGGVFFVFFHHFHGRKMLMSMYPGGKHLYIPSRTL